MTATINVFACYSKNPPQNFKRGEGGGGAGAGSAFANVFCPFILINIERLFESMWVNKYC